MRLSWPVTYQHMQHSLNSMEAVFLIARMLRGCYAVNGPMEFKLLPVNVNVNMTYMYLG